MTPRHPILWSKWIALLVSIRKIRKGQRYWLHYDGREWRAISGQTVIE